MNTASSASEPRASLLPWLRRHRLALILTVSAVALYTLAGFFLVPRIARAQLQAFVTETLQQDISIGEIRFNPYVLDASISELQIRQRDGEPLLGFRNLYVNAQLSSVWRRAIVLKDVQLAAPDVNAVIAADGTLNLAALAPADDTPPPPDSTPPRVHIGNLSVYEGRIGITDESRSEPFAAAVTPIRFTLRDFKTDADYENAYEFTGRLLSGEQLSWRGDFTVQPLGSKGEFSVQHLQATTLDSLLSPAPAFQLASGEASLSGSYRFAATPELSLAVELPLLQVNDFALAERAAPASAPIQVPQLSVHDIAFSYEQRQLKAARVTVEGAKLAVALEADGSIDLQRLFAAEGNEVDASAAQDDSAVSASVSSEARDTSGNESVAAAQSPIQSSPVPTAADSVARNDTAATTASHTSTKDNAATVAANAPSDASTADPAASAPPDWHASVDLIELRDASVQAEDRSISPAVALALDPIQLSIHDWSTQPGQTIRIDSAITLNGSGRLNANATLQLEPLQAQAELDIAGIQLPIIQPYLAGTTALTLHTGALNAKGTAQFAQTDAAPLVSFKGEISVDDLHTTDQLLKEDFIKWQRLQVAGIDYASAPARLNIQRITANQPYARVVIAKDASLNVTQVLNPDGVSEQDAQAETTATSQASSSQATALPIRIASVRVNNGTADFADYSIEPSFAAGLMQLQGDITGLSTDARSRAKVQLTGRVDRYAPVEIRGEVNLLAAAVYTDLSLDFNNIELTTFNPYSGKFAGYNISKGKLATQLHYKVQNRALQASHHIVLDNLEFGQRTDSKDAAPIPIKLAVALLKDRRGVIDLDLPVAGTLDDPEFKLGPVIWKAVMNLLTKIVTAPFAALGALFGGGEELAFVDFAPGMAALQPAQEEKLVTLAKALVERPQLRLSVPLTVVTARDTEAMANAALLQSLPIAAEAVPQDEAEQHKALASWEQAFKEHTGAAAAYPPELAEKDVAPLARIEHLRTELLAKFTPDDAALTELARQRARSVQDALLANPELAAERVFITGERSEGNAQPEAVRMEMKLE